MSTVGEIEKQTQARVVALFRDRLGYDYLGHWIDRDNRNIEQDFLRDWLRSRDVAEGLISRAIYEFDKAAGDTGKHVYDRNQAVYERLRYGVKVRPELGENTVTVWLIDWKHPEANHFAIAEEVTVKGADAKASTKRPDLVLYVNGIALGVLELKRSTVSVAEGIYQNLDNQKKAFIEPFFSTQQWVMAGNSTEGVRYGTVGTQAKYYLQWVEDSGPHSAEPGLLDRHLLQLCEKTRFLELIHDFVVFDAGTKKICRQNQYFGIKKAQDFIRRREGGIIWHTQGSGKSLTMVWLAKWILENRPEARVLIITDRTELDAQIEKVFFGVNETIYRTKSGADLIAQLNSPAESLLCSLVHKFGSKDADEDRQVAEGTKAFIDSIKKLPDNFRPKGDLYVFVDECHRTQSGDLHRAMRAILPNALFIGFTGTPLLHADKQKSIEVFGRYIDTYKFDQAVREGVVLDLRYEARNIDQRLTSSTKIDQWFEAKTQGLTELAKAQLKQKWGTLQKVLSSRSRLEKIVQDIILDMATRPRLMDGHGNAMLVAGTIYEACKYYELFAKTELKGKCAIVSSYVPTVNDTKGETTGDGETDNLLKYAVYQEMLADWFDQAKEEAIKRVEKFEEQVRDRFINQPGLMKLLIVVDKLLTGFDAPSATYLYIDKQMRDHGLFQAICRVNRLDGDDKSYGYIIDYKDLFKSLQGAVADYTGGALDGFELEDVKGLLEDRLKKGREDLETARETIKALCEAVAQPKTSEDYRRYFCGEESGNSEQLKENQPKRLKLYQYSAALIRAYAGLANELSEAGYSPSEIAQIRAEVDHFTKMRDEIKLASADYIDLKAYEPAMRHLIDTYIRAEDSETISAFEDTTLVELLVKQGPDAINALPKGIRSSESASAETIENNVRKIITNETPVDPAYYQMMSQLLDALIEQRRKGAISYREYLAKMATLAKQVSSPGGDDAGSYPAAVDTAARRAMFNNLGRDEARAMAVDAAILGSRMDGWRDNAIKRKKVRNAIRAVLADDALTDQILALAEQQHDY